jgi:hypothetical protein
MNKYNTKKVNNFRPDILINEESKDKLFNFATSHNLSDLEDFITTNSISLNVTYDNDQTIMHVLLEGESTTDEEELLRCIKFLVERGAPISSIDKFNSTPLFICIKKNYPLIFKYLLNEGASLDINTYDNLTVLHELSKPKHTTYDATGIQDLIPEKLPKMDMEKYKEVYTKINKAITTSIDPTAVTRATGVLNTGLEKFKTIVSQFYYDNNGNEDFNNELLIEDYKKNIDDAELKNDLFEKLQDQLKYFYDDTDKIEEDVLKNELDGNLNDIILNLNNNITNMQGYNVSVFNAIKNLATSLELSIHYFFLKDPENTYIAAEVAIAIAARARAAVAAGIIAGTEQAAINTALFTNIDVVRAAVQAVKAATIEAKRERNITKDIINIIKTNVVNTASGFNGLAQQAVVAVAAAITAAATVGQIQILMANPINAGTLARANNITNSVFQAIVQLPQVNQVIAILQPALAAAFAAVNIPAASALAATVVAQINNVKRNTTVAITTVMTAMLPLLPLPLLPQVNQVIAVLQTAIRAAVYASVYARNSTPIPPALAPPQVANLSAVHAAVQSSVVAGVVAGVQAVIPGGPILNQKEIQRVLTDPVIAIEAVVRAASRAASAANAIVNVTGETMVAAIREALENIEASKENIDIIIAIAEKARENAVVIGRAEPAAINVALSNVNIVREAIESIQVVKAVTIDMKRGDIINLIQTILLDEVATAPAGARAGKRGVVQIAVNNAEGIISRLIANPPNAEANAIANNIVKSIISRLIAIIRPPSVRVLVERAIAGAITVNIQNVIIPALTVVRQLNDLQTTTTTAITAALAAPPILPQVDQVKLIAVLQSTTLAVTYASVYARNSTPIPPALAPPQVANLPAVHAAVQSSVVAGMQAAIPVNQEEIQRALSDPEVAIEAVVFAASQASDAVNNIVGINGETMEAAIREALTQPPIIPQNLKNQDYNELIKLYKLINIPQKYINYDISYKYPENYLENNIREAVGLINYKLPEGDRSYAIDYFNLLYTFIEYAKDNYNPPANIDNIFDLYQHIQQIYKYNYIIYIFEKEKDKILKLKDNYTSDINSDLKKTIDDLFDKNYNELVKSVSLIREQLEIIKNLANDYIDNYNKLNGYNIYKNPNANNIEIGIYPKIEFQTEIKHTLGDENAIIANCNVYSKYNKNDFYHNLVLYFQGIGVYIAPPPALAPPDVDNSLKGIPIPINYAIDIVLNHNTNIIDNKDKAYKSYFYDSRYLKLEKQKIIENLLVDNTILQIKLQQYDNYNKKLSEDLNNKLKTNILDEILNDKFNNILVSAINNFFKNRLSNNKNKLTYNAEIKEPDFNKILLTSIGFKHILIPNYEFTNNKFLSISKNRFLKCILYFDTNYFKLTILKSLKYYKDNQFITEILKNNKSLLLKTDIKGWTPIYYAIDGNNYRVIKTILEANHNTLIHYDHKDISPLKLCIKKQLNHLNYLLTEKDEIHYLNNYIKMLKNELKSNEILIPLNIEAVFIIALFIQNHIWNTQTINLDNSVPKNTRKAQINKEYNKINTTDEDVDNDKFNNTDDKVKNVMDKPDRIYTIKKNRSYNYNVGDGDDNNIILKKYYDKAKELEKKDFGLYGSYWINYEKNDGILDHIDSSKKLKQLLKKLKIEKKNNEFNLPFYKKGNIPNNITDLNKIKTKLEYYLQFINIRFNTNKDNAYDLFLKKIYVHVLANIIGLDFYLRMEELIVNHYMNSSINLTDNNNIIIKEQLKSLNRLLINNKLDETNINYLYITEKNPESVLKDKIKEILQKLFIPDDNELIYTYETVVLPKYRDLYKITYKYLQMFISNYHKFIYNQYHGLEILLLLLDKLK